MAFLEGEPIHLSGKALLIDDLNGRHSKSKEFLESRLGREVVVITDARVLLKLLKQAANEESLPHSIISNLQRAGIGGLELAEQIRELENEKASSPHIYLLSDGEPSEDDQQRATRLRVDILDAKDLIPRQESPQE